MTTARHHINRATEILADIDENHSGDDDYSLRRVDTFARVAAAHAQTAQALIAISAVRRPV